MDRVRHFILSPGQMPIVSIVISRLYMSACISLDERLFSLNPAQSKETMCLFRSAILK